MRPNLAWTLASNKITSSTHREESTRPPTVLCTIARTLDTTNSSYNMTRQQQFSCTMVTDSAGSVPSTNPQRQLSCIMMNVETGDFLKDHADNVWFVLGAYFFAFFSRSIMHNIDFISEKWRTCRRTRALARIHLASSIFPIIYVAVYAEAQHRAE